MNTVQAYRNPGLYDDPNFYRWSGFQPDCLFLSCPRAPYICLFANRPLRQDTSLMKGVRTTPPSILLMYYRRTNTHCQKQNHNNNYNWITTATAAAILIFFFIYIHKQEKRQQVFVLHILYYTTLFSFCQEAVFLLNCKFTPSTVDL
jgi:hypothetical protein